jgi:hypothetical protein
MYFEIIPLIVLDISYVGVGIVEIIGLNDGSVVFL